MPEIINPPPLSDRTSLESQYNYEPVGTPEPLPNIPFEGLKQPMPELSGNGQPAPSALTALENSIFAKSSGDGRLRGGGIQRSLAEVTSPRYDNFMPGDYNNEDAYAQGQSWTSKMVSGVGKGLLLTGTTFLQSTVGMVNGIAKAISDGRAASFYDNDFNRMLDELNKKAEDALPNYYTDAEKAAHWYSPSKLFSANFFWDGIIKNMGFSAGAAASGYVFAAGLKALSSIPLVAKLFSVGKAAEALAATEQGMLAAGKGAETFGKLKSLSDKYLGTYNALNTGQRVLVAGLATTGEAGFEAYQNLNQFRDTKIAEYKESHGGLEPTGIDLEEINNEAEGVGNTSFLTNVALLSATNYIQFPKILGSSYQVEKGMINGITRETREIVGEAGKYAEKAATSRAGKALAAINKIRPYTFSVSEGFEEGAQYAITIGTQDYYDKKYNKKPTDFLSSMFEGIGKTIGTDEGMENVVIGGLSGALMMARGKIKGTQRKTADTAAAITSFNKFSLSDFTKETMDSVNRGTALQEDREKLLKEGNVTDSKDKEADYIINYLTPRIKYGRYDLVRDEIETYKYLASSDIGFAQLKAEGKVLEGDTKEAYTKRLINLESTADHVKSLYQSLNLRYGGVADKDGKALYTPQVLDKMVYAASKVADYDKRIPTLTPRLAEAGIDTDTLIDDITAGKVESYNEAIGKIQDLQSKKKINADQAQDLAEALDAVKNLTVRRSMFLDEYDDMKATPLKYHQVEAVETPAVVPGETPKTIKVNTKAGERDIEIGTEYFLGRVVEQDKHGNEVYRAPKIKVLGRTEDGKLQIQSIETGVIKTISDEVLEDYKLAKVSSTLANKTAKFMMAHWNTIYEYNFGKTQGGKKAGRLEYEDGKLYFVFLNSKKEVKRLQVTNKDFIAQGDFKQGRLVKKGELQAESAEQKAAREEFTSAEELKKTEATLAKTRELRLKVVLEVETAIKEDIAEISKKLLKYKEDLDNAIKMVEEAKSKLEANTSGKSLSTYKGMLTKALNVKKNAEIEVVNLTKLQSDLEMNLSYLESFKDNLDNSSSENLGEFLNELNEQLALVDDATKQTEKKITTTTKLVKAAEDAIKAIVNEIEDVVKKQNPDYPLDMRATFEAIRAGESLPEQLLALNDHLTNFALAEDLKKKYIASDAKLEKLTDKLQKLKDSLEELDAEHKVTTKLAEKFKVVHDAYEKQKEADAKMQANLALQKALQGMLSNDTQTIFQGRYEPEKKKDKFIIPRSTSGKDGKPHQIRANKFGVKFHKLDNKEDLRSIVVNINNQENVIDGLIEYIYNTIDPEDKALYKMEEILALVVVQDNKDGTYTVVDENGKPISGKDLVNKAIYQTFPGADLKWSMKYGTNDEERNMFREDVNKTEQKFIREKYAAWRKNQLAFEGKPVLQKLKVSFGIAEYVERPSAEDATKMIPDYTARTSVEQAGLVTVGDLIENPLVKITTTNTFESEGSVTFKDAKGRVFLRLPGVGLVKLLNRKFNKREAEVMFDAMLQITKNISEEGYKITKKSERLFNYLKSVSYWGIPRNKDGSRKTKDQQGHNHIWFESIDVEGKPVNRLFITGEDNVNRQFEFTAESLESNKAEIINTITEHLYNNADVKSLNTEAWKNPYFEPIGFKEDGTPIERFFPNYQTFLVSDKLFDSKGNVTGDRDNADIPFITRFRPLKSADDTNRKGIYFILDSPTAEFQIPAPAPKPTPQAPKKEEGKKPDEKKPEEKKKEVVPVYDGKTWNTMTLGVHGDVTYQLDMNKALDIKKVQPPVEGSPRGISMVKYTEALVEGGALVYNIPGEVVASQMAARPEIDSAFAGSLLIRDMMKSLMDVIVAEETIRVQPDPVVDPEPEVADQAPLPPLTHDPVDWNYDDVDNTPFRLQALEQSKKFVKEDWVKLESWIKEKYPNIPVYRVKNMIQATNGRQAWGMLQDGAIYLYEHAEVGTVYHEVFEAVWKMMAGPHEKNKVIAEFRNREGSFKDRFTGKTIEYRKATSQEIKEELAEEFRDFILYNKSVAKSPGKSLIARLFNDIVNWFNTFFFGENARQNTQDMFDKIGNGYYNKYLPFQAKLSYAQAGVMDIENAYGGENAELRVPNIPQTQMHDLIQYMTYSTLVNIINTNQSLFNLNDSDKEDQTVLYNRLNKEILGEVATRTPGIIRRQIKLYNDMKTMGEMSPEDVATNVRSLEELLKNVSQQWDEIIKSHKQYLKTFSIEFDENDEVTLVDEKSKEDPYGDSRKIDSFRKANAAIKLLLATVTYTTVVNNQRVTERSSIGGIKLIPADTVYINLMSKLYDAVDLDDMFAKLNAVAIANPNYASIYTRLTKQQPGTKVDFSILKHHDLQLMSAFWKSMKKQNADTITVFIRPGGDVIVSDTTLTSGAKEAKREMLNNVVAKIRKDKSPFFSYDKKNGTYSSTDKAVTAQLNPTQLSSYVTFLGSLGIDFKESDLEDLSDNQINMFREAVQGIKDSIIDAQGLKSLNKETLDIDGRLFELGLVTAIIKNPEFESTYFNINGERTQTYVGPNAISQLHDVLSKLKNHNDLDNTKFKFLKTDVFSKGSLMMQRMFNIGPNGSGRRIANTEGYMKAVFVDGMLDENNGKKKESSRQNSKQRLIQEINLNISGVYLNLVPGDASIEHAIKMHDQKNPFVKVQTFDNDSYLDIFRNYFISEVDLARNDRPVPIDKDGTPLYNNKDLRFFKAILGKTLHDQIMSKKNADIKPEVLYDELYNEDIIQNIKHFIDQEASDTKVMLEAFGIVSYSKEGDMIVDSLLFAKDKEMNQEILKSQLDILATNYIIANIEMHKLIYSDPYQYSDELKRIKNFNSPRQQLMYGSVELNTVLNKEYNQGFNPNDKIGYTDMTRDHFRVSTIEDVLSDNELGNYAMFEETDGGGLVMLKALRVLKIRAGQWTISNEKQFRHDVTYEKLVKSGASKEEIAKFEKGNPDVRDTYTPIKPIVSGSKDNGRDYNDIVLHKFALAALSFRVLHKINPTSNALKLYNKMQKEDIDYIVYASGSKVGSEVIHPLYNKTGSFNEAPFDIEREGLLGVSRIPFSIFSIQSEVPSKDKPLVTQGSQVTKLVTMDFMEAGVPIDFMSKEEDFEKRFIAWTELLDKEGYNDGNNLYKEIRNNQMLLEARIEEGYQTLLKKLGIVLTDKGFEINDREKLINTLKSEIGKREINDNILDAFDGFKKGEVIIEATPAYQQIRNILYSIADNNVVSPKINGGMKVQIASTLFESTREAAKDVVDKYKNTRMVFPSNELKFYKNEDGKRVCEIMVGRWFDSKKTDEELMDYFNNTEEGQKQMAALSGVAYRIPTQKQNSIDVFKVAKFLPSEYGDAVVIPSALVRKVGSDFDIDKLSIYFKNLYEDENGNIKLIPYLGTGKDAKERLKTEYYKLIQAKIGKLEKTIIKQEDLRQLFTDVAFGVASDNAMAKWVPIFKEWFADEMIDGQLDATIVRDIFEARLEALGKRLDKLTDNDLQDIIADKKGEQWYKASLENAYILSMENLISHPLNFENLVKPNSAVELQDLTKEINIKLGRKEIDYKNVGNMLNRRFMTGLRQAFVSGKYAIGIAAVAQTNHAQNQRAVITIDMNRMKTHSIDEVDKTILGNESRSKTYANNTNINFQKYNKITDTDGRVLPTLSMSKNQDSKSISDIIGQFIDGYVDISKGPWIMELGATPNVASTWLFLTKLGVPFTTVAYFMNQPIIREYLQTVENKGYSWLFISNIIDEALSKYKPDASEVVSEVNEIPSEDDLGEMVGKSSKELSAFQNQQQQYMLKEFLKYAKMSEHLFHVTQGSNFDTATLNDPFLIFKKQMQLRKARNTIISSVDDILDQSFIRVLEETMYDIRDAYAEVLISDRDSLEPGKVSVRDVMEAVLEPFVNMPNRDFVKISQKAVNDLFDWAVQTDINVNTHVVAALLGTQTKESYAKQIITFRNSIIGNGEEGSGQPKHPLYRNMILRSIKIEPGESEGKPDNIYLAGRDNKVYDQNLIIYEFQELYKHLNGIDSKLYTNLVALAVIQSGLTNSKIAFTNLLPYKDFKNVYNKTLSNLENMPNLGDFHKLNVFQRNNWNNNDIVDYYRAKMKVSSSYMNPLSSELYDPGVKFLIPNLKKAVANKVLPMIAGVGTMSSEGRSDFLVYSWETSIGKKEKIRMKKAGDRSYIKKALMQKVYTEDEFGNRIPLVQVTMNKKGKEYKKYIYKAINAWGDSFRAQEFYATARASVLNNDFIKVRKTVDANNKPLSAGEVSDDEVVNIFNGSITAGESMVEDPNLSWGDMEFSRDELLEDYSYTTGEQELSPENTNFESTMTLKDGITYAHSQIGAMMLETIGYTPKQIGDILKSIC